MGKFSDALPIVQKSEGGYVNHKNDRGGETNYGVTKATFLEAKRQRILSKDIVNVANITKKDAEKVFKQMYWNKMHGDDLPRDLSIAVFDMAINSGPKTAIKTLQKVLGVSQNGTIGSETLLAINNYKGDLLDDYLKAREAKYLAIVKKKPTQKVFIKGWLNRLKDLRKYIAKLPPMTRTPVAESYRDQLQRILDKWETYVTHKIRERWW